MQHKGAGGRRGKDGAVWRFLRWVASRRRIAADQILRGACYSTGSTAVALIAFWVRHRM